MVEIRKYTENTTTLYDKKLHATQVRNVGTGFTMWYTDITKNVFSAIGWKEVRHAFSNEIQRITSDPFGETSIDPDPSLRAQRLRTLNKVTGPLQKYFSDQPLVLKGTGKTVVEDPLRENLLEQFQVLQRLEMRSRRLTYATPEVRKLIRPIHVFGAVQYPIEGEQGIQEWLLMEMVQNAKALEQIQIYPVPDHLNNYFFANQHPELAAFVLQYCPPKYFEQIDKLIRYRSLRHALRVSSHINLATLQDRDILYTTDDMGNKQYRIIDIKNSDLIQPIEIK